ncbi:CAP domain-containing protein [Paracoccus sp. (in: a-proteobacteria)]|uniref:CAP domain-containing protein n=1 Tax=Paracoccus sp. TaxID=267 RepID=UPI0026E049E3|nr:CAP domain-containing protein [Paracoccus sp. (in: a-proteobacteria)]MDO5648749.1 CAP domain-containing protein [Paracoccus sp. (in: a-proteobacteria)]
MNKIKLVGLLAVMALPACMPQMPGPGMMPDVAPVAEPVAAAQVDSAQIQARVLQQINTLRGNIGLNPLVQSPQLDAAALQHSRDMSAQNRAWHWGSDGTSPLDRARSQGYGGRILGENISESYEDDMQTLSAWMSKRDTRDVIMDPAAVNLGFAWYKEASGKLWWTLLAGT